MSQLANDNFSLHDDEELSLHDDTFWMDLVLPFSPHSIEHVLLMRKKRKARTLTANGCSRTINLRRFMGMDGLPRDRAAQDSTVCGTWRTRKKWQKLLLKQQFEALLSRLRKSLRERPKPLPASISQATTQEVIVLIPLPLPKQQQLLLLIAMTAIKIKKFYKKTGRGQEWMEKCMWHLIREKSNVSIATILGILPGSASLKSKEGSRQEADSYNALQAKYDELQSEFGDQEAALIAHKLALNQILKDEKLKKYRRIGMKAVKDKDALQKIVDSWFASSKNLWKLIDCGMSSTVKIGLGYGIQSNAEVLGYEEEISRGIFALRETDAGYYDIPLYSRFKQVEYKGVPHPLSGDYTPREQEDIDDSLDGELGAVSDHSVNDDPIHDHIPIPSIEQHVKTPRQPIRTPVTPSPIPSNNRQNWNQRMERELGAGYSFERKTCFVCGSLSHLIKDCDYYEKKMAREAALKSQRVVHADVRQATPAWTNTNRVNKANQFTPRPVQLNNIRPNLSTTASKTIKTGRVNAHLEDIQELSKVGNLLLIWRSKGSISGKDNVPLKVPEATQSYHDIPLFSRFKQVEYKGVPPPLSGDYTPVAQEVRSP
ncbi:hypothetical protein Tco_1385860 [Tanacetum coccineum]